MFISIQVQGTSHEHKLLTILQHLSQLGRAESGHVGGWRAVEKAAAEWEDGEEGQGQVTGVSGDTHNGHTNGSLPDLVTNSDKKSLPSPTSVTRLVPWQATGEQDGEVTGDRCLWQAACQLPVNNIDWAELERCFPLTGSCLRASDAGIRSKDRYSKEEVH